MNQGGNDKTQKIKDFSAETFALFQNLLKNRKRHLPRQALQVSYGSGK